MGGPAARLKILLMAEVQDVDAPIGALKEMGIAHPIGEPFGAEQIEERAFSKLRDAILKETQG